MFLFKKILSQFLFPMPLCLCFCFAGLALLWWSKQQRLGKILVTVGITLLTAFSYEFVADALLIPLERRYPVYERAAGAGASFVVVLGGGHSTDLSVPISSRLSTESLKRLIEGIRVCRENPGCKLLLSGGKSSGNLAEADTLAEVAQLLGISAADIIKENGSRDTLDQAETIKGLVGQSPFVLVTSANHMPRAMTLFRQQGMVPIPAPAQHMAQQHRLEPAVFFPNGRNLNWVEQVFHEHIGTLWLNLTRPPAKFPNTAQ